MDVRKIMIIRHAEKPPKTGPLPRGVALDGQHSPNELIPRGWQRAGALVTLFAPWNGSAPQPPVERPAAVFAAGTSPDSPSLRPQSTVGPVAQALRPTAAVQVLSAPGQEPAAARAILDSGFEVVLVCWEHKHIVDLVRAITDGAVDAPHWHGSRFDVTFVLTREADGWRFEQVPQTLLAGDMDAPVSIPDPNAADGEGEN